MENIREFYEVYANYPNKPSERVAGYSKETALKVLEDETGEQIVDLFVECYDEKDFLEFLNKNDFDLFNNYRYSERVYRSDYSSDEDFRKAKEVNNDKHLYNQAGNSIVVNVLEEIFKNLFKGE